MAGITRIRINSNWNNERLEMSQSLSPAADEMYRDIFAGVNLELLPGVEIIDCTKEEAVSRYDYIEGIDVILRFTNGHKATMQEKYLTYRKDTITFSETKQDGSPGSWYTCTAQYYSTMYARRYPEILEFQSYMIVDLPYLHRVDALRAHTPSQLHWFHKDNNGRYAGIRFRYLYFDDVPEEVVVATNRIRLPINDMTRMQYELFG